MPPRQVYGKKRAHVFNHNIFLETPVKIKTEESALDQLTNTISKLKLTPKQDGKNHGSRQALGEISENTGKALITESKQASTPYKQAKVAIVEVYPEVQPESPIKTTIDDEHDVQPLISPGSGIGKERVALEARQDSPHDLTYSEHLGALFSLTSPELTLFADFDASLSAQLEISKIAEASFSQVFMLSLPTTDGSLPQTSVLKLIPLQPPPDSIPKRRTKALNALLDLCSTPANVASEVRLLRHLSPVPGFVNFRALHLLRGRPGPAFSAGYKAWNSLQRENGRDRSHFPDPNKPKSYNDDQLWAVIEMQDAGSDLERLIETHDWGALGIAAVWDVFWQIVLACGKAETASNFEHRDMHLGNICVTLGQGKKIKSDKKHKTKLGSTGLEATVIDYTISRAEIPSETDQNEVAYIDLNEDQALFEGDAAEEYQYEIYRYMRSAVFLDSPMANYEDRWEEAEASGRTWRGYHPQSNVVWLHFILCRLMENHELWQAEEPQKSQHFSATAVQQYEVLTEVNDMLHMENWRKSGLRSAGDVVALALKRKWLDIKDVTGLVGQQDTLPQRERKTNRVR